jgi:hypothetical protein
MPYIYLLHFEERIGDLTRPHTSAQHYLGWADRYDLRIRAHINGYSDASIVRFVHSRGIGIRAVRLFSGEGACRDVERLLKKGGRAPRFCPICNPKAWHRSPSALWLYEHHLYDSSELLDTTMTGEDWHKARGRQWKKHYTELQGEYRNVSGRSRKSLSELKEQVVRKYGTPR